MADGGPATTPSRRGWSGSGRGYYADPKSPIASTPKRGGRGYPSTPSTAALSPMRVPERTKVRKHTDHGPEGDVDTDGVPDKALFSPSVTYAHEDGGDKGVALDAPPKGRAAARAAAHAARAEAEAAAAREAAARAEAEAAAARAAEEEAARGGDDYDGMEYEEFNPYLFIKLLPPYRDVAPPRPRILLPAKSRAAPDLSLVLDLDETLVHCSIDPVSDADLTFPVEFGGATYEVYVRKRPYLDRFLRAVAGKFEVTVFTASQRVYAEKLLDLLDPRGELITHRLYREACLNVEGNFLKDLTVLGRDMRKTMLVDNSPHAFGYQPANGIPIESWFDDPRDTELLKLKAFLDTLPGTSDVRPHLRAKFRVHELIDSAM